MVYIYLYIISILIIIYYIYKEFFYINNNGNSTYSTYVLYIPERYEYIKEEMNKTQLEPIYVKGYEKNKLSKQLVQEQGKTPGKIACHMGHLYILDKFIKSDDDYAFILEDDIYFKDHNMIKSKIDYIIKTCPRDADIIFVSYCLEKCDYINDLEIFSRARAPLCRHAYIVNKRCAKMILKKTWPMNEHGGPGGDNLYSKLMINNEIIPYTVNNNFISIEQNREKLGSKLGGYESGKAPPRCVR